MARNAGHEQILPHRETDEAIVRSLRGGGDEEPDREEWTTVSHQPTADPRSVVRTATRAALFLAAVLLAAPSTARAQAESELDAYWDEVSRTVAEGDFEGYARLYHPDAVLVVGGTGTYPIESALAGWKQGFVDTREGRAEAGVAFRFTGRLSGEETAFETGMFRYALEPDEGDDVVALVRFEALLVKKDGRWLMLMENQQGPATDEEWEDAR
ncbi:MAG: nuclear transport factor 2 family protein [Gemmatimonadota bacterium]